MSMFSLFGTKLFNGPMWRVESTSQDQEQVDVHKRSPVQVNYCVGILCMLCFIAILCKEKGSYVFVIKTLFTIVGKNQCTWLI